MMLLMLRCLHDPKYAIPCQERPTQRLVTRIMGTEMDKKKDMKRILGLCRGCPTLKPDPIGHAGFHISSIMRFTLLLDSARIVAADCVAI